MQVMLLTFFEIEARVPLQPMCWKVFARRSGHLMFAVEMNSLHPFVVVVDLGRTYLFWLMNLLRYAIHLARALWMQLLSCHHVLWTEKKLVEIRDFCGL